MSEVYKQHFYDAYHNGPVDDEATEDLQKVLEVTHLPNNVRIKYVAPAMTPHFDESTIGQRLINTDGEAAFSLSIVPSTIGHSHDMHDRTGRSQYLAFDEMRQAKTAELETINAEYQEQIVISGPDGCNVGLRHVNRQATEGTIGVMTSWSTDANWVNERGIIEALALTYPNMQVVFIETPGMGNSDKLTDSRKKALIDTGSFAPIAEQLVGALQETDLTFDVLIGISEGGRGVISLAEQLAVLPDAQPPVVVVLDPPGSKEQPVPVFAKHFALDEQTAQQQVIKASPDLIMADGHKNIDSKILFKQPVKVFNRQLFARVRAMARAGIAGDITAACASGVTIYDYRCEMSTFASNQAMEELARATKGYNAIILPGAPHGVNEGNPFAVRQLVAQALNLHVTK